MTQKITIDGTAYPVKFGYKAIKSFCMEFKPEFKGPVDLYKYLLANDWKNLSFESVKEIAEVIRLSIANGQFVEGIEENPPEVKIVEEWLFDDVENLVSFYTIITESLPKEDSKKKGQGEAEKEMK